MAICEVCGNEYDKPFQVWRNGRLMKFDRVECAIQMMGPACAVCGAHIMGRGVEVGGEMFCSLGCVLVNKGGSGDQAYERSHIDNEPRPKSKLPYGRANFGSADSDV